MRKVIAFVACVAIVLSSPVLLVLWAVSETRKLFDEISGSDTFWGGRA